MNTFGEKFSFTSFGESHGRAIGGVLDGVPAGLHIDLDLIQSELDRRAGRKPTPTPSLKGREHISGVSPRAVREADEVEWLSGVMDGVTLGTPIAFIIRNKDARPEDYEHLKHTYRIGHADKVYEQKYGIRDYRGGGRSSARETVSRIVAGAFAKLVLKQMDIEVVAYTSQIGDIKLSETAVCTFSEIESNAVRCPDSLVAKQMIDLIEQIRSEGDSIGGVVSCVVKNMPVGIGEPVFDKLSARLAYAMLSINAAKGFDYGSGFLGVNKKGSEQNDEFYVSDNRIALGESLDTNGKHHHIRMDGRLIFQQHIHSTVTLRKALYAVAQRQLDTVFPHFGVDERSHIRIKGVHQLLGSLNDGHIHTQFP